MSGYLRATAIVAGLTLATNLLGFVREVLFARAFGAAGRADVYITAASIVAVCFLVFSAGSLQGAFMPRYQQALVQGDGGRARGLWRGVLRALALVLVLIALALWLGADTWVGLVVPGFDPERRRETADLLRRLAPMVLFAGLGSLFQSVAHAHQRFLLPALVPFLNNVVLIGTLLLVVPYAGVSGFAHGAVGGSALALLLLPQVLRLLPDAVATRAAGAVRETGIAMLPLVALLATDQFSALLQKTFVSDLAIGSIAVLNYAARLEGLPVGIFAAAIATVYFPALVEALSRGDRALIEARFRSGLGALCFCMVPATVFLLLQARPTVSVLFERGAFDAEATLRAADALRLYALGLLPQGVIVFVNRFYFAAGDTRTPMRIGIYAALAHVGLCRMLVGAIDYLGIALGTSLYALVYAGLLLAGLGRVLAAPWSCLLPCLWRPLLAGAAMAAVSLAWPFPETVAGLALALASGALAYLAAARVLGEPLLRGRPG